MTPQVVSRAPDTVLVDEAIGRLEQERASIRCKDIQSLLENLGFVVKSLKTQNHKLAKHGTIKALYLDYDCGHGKNPVPLSAYVNKIRRFLSNNRDEIAKWEQSR